MSATTNRSYTCTTSKLKKLRWIQTYIFVFIIYLLIKFNPFPQYVIIQIKAIELEIHAVLFATMYKGVLTFIESADETLVRDHSRESCRVTFHVVLFIILYKVIRTLSIL